MAKKIFDYELVTYEPTNFQIVPSTVNVTVGCDELDSNHLERFLIDGGVYKELQFYREQSNADVESWDKAVGKMDKPDEINKFTDQCAKMLKGKVAGVEKQVNGLLDAAWEKEKKANNACLKYKLVTAVTVSAAVLGLAKSIAALVASAGTAIPAYIAAAKAIKTLATEVKKAFESAESSREELQTALEKLEKDEEKSKSTVSAADSALKDYNQKLTNARKSADELAGKLDEALEASEKDKLGDTRDREAAIDKMIKKIIELNEARGQGESYADKAGALIKAAKEDSKMDLKTLKSYAAKAQSALNVVKEIATYASQLL
jgi:hypothetical protein